MFNPLYRLTDRMVSSLSAIAEAKSFIDRAKLLPKQEMNLRRQALIRMTHSSTRIEGNMLNIRQVEAVAARKKIDAPARDIFEVENYFSALRHISQVVQKKQPLSEKVLLKIHQLVTQKTLPSHQSGQYRTVPIYIVQRRLGAPDDVVYTGPEAKRVPQLTADLISWLQSSAKKNIHPVVAAGIAHQELAAIHPFSDGNGRTARAIATLILYQRGYDFRRLFALEDFYNKDRPAYYKAINIGKNYQERRTDFTSWLEYFVEGFKQEINSVKTRVMSLSMRKVDDQLNSQVYLDPEQVQILDFLDQMGKITVKDVVDILECPRRTAQLYLQRLKKLKMIVQVGKGPSSAYSL